MAGPLTVEAFLVALAGNAATTWPETSNHCTHQNGPPSWKTLAEAAAFLASQAVGVF